MFAGRPHEAAARSKHDFAIAVIIVADRDPAIAVAKVAAESRWQIRRVVVAKCAGLHPHRARHRVTQHAADAGTASASKSNAPVGAGRSARNIRPCSSKVIFEISVGPVDGGMASSMARVAAKRAVGAQTDRPDLQAGGDCVVQAVLINGEAEDADARALHNSRSRAGCCRTAGW